MSVRVSLRMFALPAIALVSAAAPNAGAALISHVYNQSLDNGNFTSVASLTTKIDFNSDGTNDFSFIHSTGNPGPSPSNTGDYNGSLLMNSATPSQFLAFVKDNDTYAQGSGTRSPIGDYVETLPAGYSVGGSGLNGFITASPGTTAYDNRLLDSSGTGNGGAFSVATGERNPLLGNVPNYVGFAFGDPNNPNYGYLVFTNIGNDDRFIEGDRNAATLQAIVYNTTPGVPVVIPVPEPLSLGAIGGAGLLMLRRRKA